MNMCNACNYFLYVSIGYIYRISTPTQTIEGWDVHN